MLTPGETTLRLKVCGEWGDCLTTPTDALGDYTGAVALPANPEVGSCVTLYAESETEGGYSYSGLAEWAVTSHEQKCVKQKRVKHKINELK